MTHTPSPDSDQAAVHPVSDDLESTVATLARIGRCWSPAFSPDGRRIAFVSDLSGVPQVWTVASEGGWPDRVTALDDQVSRVIWSPDGARLAFSMAPGGGLNEQIYVCKPDGTDLRRLTDGGTTNNQLGQWTHSGTSLTISSNRRTPEAMDAYLLDADSGDLTRVAQNSGIGHLTDIDQERGRALLYRMVSRGDNDLYLVDVTDGSEQVLTAHKGPGTFQNGHFSQDGRRMYCSSNANRDRVAFAQVAIDDHGMPGPIEVIAERDDAELDAFTIDELGTTAALLWNVAGKHELSLLNLSTRTVTPAPALPAELALTPTFSADGMLLALAVSGAQAPMDIWLLDLAANQYRQVTHSPHASVALQSLVQPELIRFPAHDGLGLSGWLYRAPQRGTPGPLVLSFHGGPESQERPTFSSVYQALLRQGISILAPNVRGSTGFGKAFVNLDNGPLRVNAVRDIQACVTAAISSGSADPQRIGIMGGSYGGYMTMAGLVEYPELFAAGANLFGIVNFETFFAYTEPWMAAISKVEYGDPETEVELLRMLSPIHRIDRVVAPTLVLHGANDTNVPVQEAEQLVAILKERGVPVEYILYPDEGHGFKKVVNSTDSALHIVRWFVRHLAS